MCFSLNVKISKKELQEKFGAISQAKAYEDFESLKEFEASLWKSNKGKNDSSEVKEYFGLPRKPTKNFIKSVGDDGRVYPNYFFDAVMKRHGEKVIVPMRYNLRPSWAKEELPQKYNLFNARYDSLEERRSWKNLYGKNHCLIPYRAFYEFVYSEKISNDELKNKIPPEKKDKAQLISFWSPEKEILWSPALFDVWKSQNKEHYFLSTALITSDPIAQVKAAGHDRSPIFLKDTQIDQWLDTENNSIKEFNFLLENPRPQSFEIVI